MAAAATVVNYTITKEENGRIVLETSLKALGVLGGSDEKIILVSGLTINRNLYIDTTFLLFQEEHDYHNSGSNCSCAHS